MSDNDTRNEESVGVDEDRTEGSAKQFGGKMKEGAGKLLGDSKLKNEGLADQAEGKLQNSWGSMKDEVREAVGSDRDEDDR